MGKTGIRLLAPMIGLAIGATHARAEAPEIGEALKQPQAQSDLQLITKSAETLNKAELLHLGIRSNEVRKAMIKDADRYIFVSVPYWWGDETGKEALDLIDKQVHARTGLDFRVMMDWSSPASVKDPLRTGITKQIQVVAEGKLGLWNRPAAQRSHSFDPLKNRQHDKFLVVDGKKLLLGGMNIGDEYLKGGLTEAGWHDTDLFLEGPAAEEVGKLFLKLYELTKYLESPAHYPPDEKERTIALQNLFYKDMPETSFLSMDPDYGTEGHDKPQIRYDATIPVRKYFTDEKYFPKHPVCPEYTVPVRVIYDNTLVDHVTKDDPWYAGKLKMKRGRNFSKIMTTFTYLAGLTKRSLRMFVPYLTPEDRFLGTLESLAKRGVEVSIITNSMRTNDLGSIPYLAGVGHYRELLQAGVRIYEWQGHPKLKDLETGKGCRIEPGTWPGVTIHTKAAIFDEQVLMLGSHNFNERSQSFNNEIMAVVNDAGIASSMNAVFQKDVDSSWRGKIPCSGGVSVEWPAQIEAITITNLDDKLKKYERDASFLDNLQQFF